MTKGWYTKLRFFLKPNDYVHGVLGPSPASTITYHSSPGPDGLRPLLFTKIPNTCPDGTETSKEALKFSTAFKKCLVDSDCLIETEE